MAAAGRRRHERGEGHAQLGPAFLRFDRRGEFACERVDDEEIAAGAAHIEPDACELARIDRTDRTTAQGHEDAALGLVLERSSEEHTSELQSLMRISYAVFCLKKKIAMIELTDHLYTLHSPSPN